MKNIVINESISYFVNNYDKMILENIEFKKNIYYLFTILFNGYLNKENELNNSEHLFATISKELNNSNISKYIDEIINCYNNISEKFIDKIKEEKAIYFLDKQAINEIKNNNLEIKDKCIKYDFIKIIESFLKNNFYSISQKYFIYYSFIPIIERFIEKIENEVNENLINILSNNSQIFKLFTEIYTQKIGDLNKIIQEYLNKDGYHKSPNVIKIKKNNNEVNVNEIDEIYFGDGEGEGEEKENNNNDI